MTRKSRPQRACPMCKYHKYTGNAKQRRPIADRRKLQRED